MVLYLIIFITLIIVINTTYDLLFGEQPERSIHSMELSSLNKSYYDYTYNLDQFKECYIYTGKLWELISLYDKQPYSIEICQNYIRVDIIIDHRLISTLQFYRNNSIPALSEKQIKMIYNLLMVQLDEVYNGQYSIQNFDFYDLIFLMNP